MYGKSFSLWRAQHSLESATFKTTFDRLTRATFPHTIVKLQFSFVVSSVPFMSLYSLCEFARTFGYLLAIIALPCRHTSNDAMECNIQTQHSENTTTTWIFLQGHSRRNLVWVCEAIRTILGRRFHRRTDLLYVRLGHVEICWTLVRNDDFQIRCVTSIKTAAFEWNVMEISLTDIIAHVLDVCVDCITHYTPNFFSLKVYAQYM